MKNQEIKAMYICIMNVLFLLGYYNLLFSIAHFI